MQYLILDFLAQAATRSTTTTSTTPDSTSIIGWIVFGLIAGAIAKFLVPGRDPGGWIVTILLGIAGSFVGGFLASMLGFGGGPAGWIGSILGAIILLLIYRMVVGRRAP
jgi:uncharacterized membrane protein YeaQ/YmgE (transglycosylase-associated protein family)